MFVKLITNEWSVPVKNLIASVNKDEGHQIITIVRNHHGKLIKSINCLASHQSAVPHCPLVVDWSHLQIKWEVCLSADAA